MVLLVSMVPLIQVQVSVLQGNTNARIVIHIFHRIVPLVAAAVAHTKGVMSVVRIGVVVLVDIVILIDYHIVIQNTPTKISTQAQLRPQRVVTQLQLATQYHTIQTAVAELCLVNISCTDIHKH